jgi:hypothetical protein
MKILYCQELNIWFGILRRTMPTPKQAYDSIAGIQNTHTQKKHNISKPGLDIMNFG